MKSATPPVPQSSAQKRKRLLSSSSGSSLPQSTTQYRTNSFPPTFLRIHFSFQALASPVIRASVPIFNRVRGFRPDSHQFSTRRYRFSIDSRSSAVSLHLSSHRRLLSDQSPSPVQCTFSNAQNIRQAVSVISRSSLPSNFTFRLVYFLSVRV